MIARVKFTKTGSSKFIGHLDLLRYFQKAFRRAKLDLTYSQGYNPHPLITIAAPLGVGLSSEGEYLDVTLNSCDNEDVMIDRINEAMANNISVIDFIILPEGSKNAMSIVAAADYIVSLKEGYDFLSTEDFQDKFREFYNQDTIKIIKKTKRSEIEMDLKPLVYKYEFIDNNKSEDGKEDLPSIYLQLATGSANNIKTDLVLETFCKFANIAYNPFAFDIHRVDTYANIGNYEDRKLVPLNKMFD
jgi:radical SAM-linked protein